MSNVASAVAQVRQPSLEYDVKVAYLYKFLIYFTWPDSSFETSQSPFVVGVLGEDPFGARLDAVAKARTVKGRRIVVRRFKTWDSMEPCHILFLSQVSAEKTRAEAVHRTRKTPILLVGETPGYAVRGAAVNFYIDGNGTVGFEVNVDTTTDRNLRVDARLLQIARVVRGRPKVPNEQ